MPSRADHRAAEETEVDAWIAATLGPVTTYADRTRLLGRVVEVADRDGVRWVVKTSNPGAHRREVAAYRTWAPHFDDQAPRLRAASAALRTMVLQHVPGPIDWRCRAPVHAEAGRLLRRIHDSAPPRTDGPGVAEVAEQRLRRALAGAAERRLLGAAELELATSAVAVLRRDHADLPRVRCHGDYGPHNWVQGEDRLFVIDFSSARWNSPASDFARLQLGSWWRRPERSEAFFEGYGRTPDDAEVEAARLLMAANAVSLLVYARDRGNRAIERRARRRLAALVERDGVPAG